jgi:hypothetical protein
MPDGGRSKGDRACRRVSVLISALVARNAVAAAGIVLPREAIGPGSRGPGSSSEAVPQRPEPHRPD